MKHKWILLCAALAVSPVQASDALKTVLDCMRANVPESARTQQLEVTATDRSGNTRVLTGKVFAMAETTPMGPRLRALLKVNSPSDLAGAAYLVRESENYLQDGMYVYLPSVRRVRRVSGTFADGALLGTNFSYNDFRQVQTAFVDAGTTLEGEEQLDSRPVYRLLVVPALEQKSPYSQVHVWVDRKTCVPLKTEFRKGVNGQTLVKELTVPANALQQSGTHWFASMAQMRDLSEGTSSVMRIIGTQLNAVIPPSNFDPTSFYLGK